MAKIVPKTLTFVPSISPDVVGYRLYYEEVPNAVTENSLYVDLGATQTSVALHEIPEFSSFDGLYNIGISAVDDSGNESDMSKLGDIPLDLSPPEPPTQLTLL